MQVNFKGLYKIPGSWENSTGNGETMHDISNRKLQSFIEDTQYYMEPNGCAYRSKDNGDVYFTVKRESEPYFEDKADSYNIDCRKVADNIAGNNDICEKLCPSIMQKKLDEISNYNDMEKLYKTRLNRMA